jgi:hypothetical protein
MAVVWGLQLPFNQAWVLMALADFAHDDGSRCFPGVDRLAHKTGYGERQVRRLLHDLREIGLIEAVAFLGGGRGRATEYRLRLEKGVKKSPFIKEDISETLTPRDLNPDTHGQKGDLPGQKEDLAVTPQPLRTITQTSEEPLVHSGTDTTWLRTLRSIDGWAAKGEPHIDSLLAWVNEKGWTLDELEASAIGLAATSDKTLKGYRTMAGAFQRRLNQGYDKPGRVPVDGRDPTGDTSQVTSGGRAEGWDNRSDRA